MQKQNRVFRLSPPFVLDRGQNKVLENVTATPLNRSLSLFSNVSVSSLALSPLKVIGQLGRSPFVPFRNRGLQSE